MQRMQIETVLGREILDSRGNPTVEAEVILVDGTRARAAAPSGASTGSFEAVELRDRDSARYDGRGVMRAVENINTVIGTAINGLNAADTAAVDQTLIELDGTQDKSSLGANALLAVSIATARAAASSLKIPFFRFLGGIAGTRLPVPLMNILNGGIHAGNTLDVQEFMIVPVGASSFSEGLRWGTEVFHMLAEVLKSQKQATSVGDEGGFAPDLSGTEEAIACILSAIEMTGYTAGTDIAIAIDAAASGWKSENDGYILPKSGKIFTAEDITGWWKSLVDAYPIISIEDPLDEEDWDGWQLFTKELGSRIQVVGDDLFVTNAERLKKGSAQNCANSILIKLNQIGTVTETLETIQTAHEAGYTTIISHRSGETEDPAIADLAVAVNACQIKTGAPCRSERVAKYNRLLRIEEFLGSAAIYPGLNAFYYRV